MITGCLMDLVNATACVGTAVTLFRVTKRQSEALAFGSVASRLFEMAANMIGIVCLLAVVVLRHPCGDRSAAWPIFMARSSLPTTCCTSIRLTNP